MIQNGIYVNRSPLLPYWGWNAYTPVIPKLYWDCESAEQAVKNLWKSFDNLTHYASYIAENVNALDYATPEELYDLQKDIEEKLYVIEELIKSLTVSGNELIWSVHDAEYLPSIDAMRNTFNFVTERSYRNSDLAGMNLTVSVVADCGLNVEGWAVCNSYYIKNKMNDVLPQYKEII